MPGAVAGAGTDASTGDVATPSAAALLQCQVLWQQQGHEAKQHFSLDIVRTEERLIAATSMEGLPHARRL